MDSIYEEEARREGRELPLLPGDKDVGDGEMSLREYPRFLFRSRDRG